MSIRRTGVCALLVTGMLAVSGCGLFETRDPIVSEGDDSIWQTPTTPEIIIDNLEAALEAGNFSDYLRAFTTDFVFRPDEADVAQLAISRPGEMVYEGWDRDVETQVAETIFGAVDDVDVSFVFLDEVFIAAGRILEYDYVLSLTTAGSVTEKRGEVWFQVRNESGEWLIFDWEDIANAPQADSWGLFKGQSRPSTGRRAPAAP